jgi:catechol 2,3-dioxygenase-like lactoylglutathione lyase family enzyme
MSEGRNFIQITPFMHVPDLNAAVVFFEYILGFKTLFRQSDYAYIEREGVGIRMLQNHGDDGARPATGVSAITSTFATSMRSTQN